MRAHSANSRLGGAAAAGLALAVLPGAAPAGVPAASAPLSFGMTFATRGEPRQLHYRVLYRTGTGVHRLEVWRDGDRLIKRVTDDGVATLVRHVPGSPEFVMQVVDPRRHTSTRIDRTSLYRVGNFTDWFDLGHGLRHPRGPYRLTAGTPPGPMPRLAAACRWYTLAEEGGSTSVCWDAADRLPLLLADASGRPVWRVMSLDRSPIAPAVFRLADQGFIHDDAARDISDD